MNYGKLQLSFILLLIMTIIQLLTALFVVKKTWLIFTSLIAIILCIIGLTYTLRQEAALHHKEDASKKQD